MSISKTNPFYPFWVAMMTVFAFPSCSSDSDEPGGKCDIVPQVVVLYSLGGLGDQGYNDCILTGVQTFRKEYADRVEIYQYSPHSMSEAERLFTDWLQLSGGGTPSLFVVASNDYEAMVGKAMGGYVPTENKQVLMFESDNPQRLPVGHFRISMYGASFLAGVSAAQCGAEKALAMLAHPYDTGQEDAARGFRDGFIRPNPQGTVETVYLADDWTGFVADSLAYHRMYDWSTSYDFIYPLAGGSNKGVYRYTREYAQVPLTAGMDVDESGLSRVIVGSLVKRMDKLVVHCLRRWTDTGELPEPAIYGLESGYVDWQIAPTYKDRAEQAVKEIRMVAIQKEEEYLYEK